MLAEDVNLSDLRQKALASLRSSKSQPSLDTPPPPPPAREPAPSARFVQSPSAPQLRSVPTAGQSLSHRFPPPPRLIPAVQRQVHTPPLLSRQPEPPQPSSTVEDGEIVAAPAQEKADEESPRQRKRTRATISAAASSSSESDESSESESDGGVVPDSSLDYSDADTPQLYNSLTIVPLGESDDDDSAEESSSQSESDSAAESSSSSSSSSSSDKDDDELDVRVMKKKRALEMQSETAQQREAPSEEDKIAAIESQLQKDEHALLKNQRKLLRLKKKSLQEKNTTSALEGRVSLLRTKLSLLESELQLARLRYDASVDNCSRTSDLMKQLMLKMQIRRQELHFLKCGDASSFSSSSSSSSSFNSSLSSSSDASDACKRQRLVDGSFAVPAVDEASAAATMCPLCPIAGDFLQMYPVDQQSVFGLFSLRRAACSPSERQDESAFDPSQELCPDELQGDCLNDACTYQHFGAKPARLAARWKPMAVPTKNSRAPSASPIVEEYFAVFGGSDAAPADQPASPTSTPTPTLTATTIDDNEDFLGFSEAALHKDDVAAQVERNPHQPQLWISLAKLQGKRAKSKAAAREAFFRTLRRGVDRNPQSTLLWIHYLDALAPRKPPPEQLQSEFFAAISQVDQREAPLLWKLMATTPALNATLEQAVDVCERALSALVESRGVFDAQHRRRSSRFFLYFAVRAAYLHSLADELGRAKAFLAHAIDAYAGDMLGQHVVLLRLYAVHLDVFGPLPSGALAAFDQPFLLNWSVAATPVEQTRLIFEAHLLAHGQHGGEPAALLWINYVRMEQALAGSDDRRDASVVQRFLQASPKSKDALWLQLQLRGVDGSPLAPETSLFAPLDSRWDLGCLVFAYAEALLRRDAHAHRAAARQTLVDWLAYLVLNSDVAATGCHRADDLESVGFFRRWLTDTSALGLRHVNCNTSGCICAGQQHDPVQLLWAWRCLALLACVDASSAAASSSSSSCSPPTAVDQILSTAIEIFASDVHLLRQLWRDFLSVDPLMLEPFLSDSTRRIRAHPTFLPSLLPCLPPHSAQLSNQLSVLLKFAPSNEQAWVAVADALVRLGHRSEAASVLHRATHFFPASAAVYSKLIAAMLAERADASKLEYVLRNVHFHSDLRFCKNLWLRLLDVYPTLHSLLDMLLRPLACS